MELVNIEASHGGQIKTNESERRLKPSFHHPQMDYDAWPFIGGSQ